MTRPSRLPLTRSDVVLATSGWLVLLAVTQLPPATPLRIALAAAFLLYAPGAAIVRLTPLRQPLERHVTAIALSMAATLLVSVAFTAARDDSLDHRLQTLAALTTAAVLLQPSVLGHCRALLARTSTTSRRTA